MNKWYIRKLFEEIYNYYLKLNYMNYYYSQLMTATESSRQGFFKTMTDAQNDSFAFNKSIISLNNLAQYFWLWNNQATEQNLWNLNDQQSLLDSSKVLIQNYMPEYLLMQQSSNLISQDHNTLKRSRKNSLPNIDKNLQIILKLSFQENEVVFKHSNKCGRGLFHGISSRRSRYIGVLKNRGNWQVLINEGRIKKYIGSYPNEVEAAVVHDFYSIGINGLSAKTNFSYDQDQVMKMISSYYSNNKIFDPSIL